MADGDARLLALDGLDPVLDEAGPARLGAAGAADGETLFLGLDGGRALFAPLIRTEALGAARLVRVPAARLDERARTRRSGARRAASTNGTTAIVSAAFAGRRPRSSAPAGAATARAAAPSISRASIRW